jgi:hypothetical protein
MMARALRRPCETKWSENIWLCVTQNTIRTNKLQACRPFGIRQRSLSELLARPPKINDDRR